VEKALLVAVVAVVAMGVVEGVEEDGDARGTII